MYALTSGTGLSSAQCRPRAWGQRVDGGVLVPPLVRGLCPHQHLQHGAHASSFSKASRARRSFVQLQAFGGPAGASTSTKTEQQAWWKKETDLWVEVHDAASWEREVLQSSKPVVVDWYASWCTGCQRSYPEVCKVLRNSQELRSAFKFVKVCVDDFPKAFTRDQGVTALPRMSLYRAGAGRLLTWDIPVSRVKFLKQNLTTIQNNPTSGFALDPNNFVVATGKPPSDAEAKKEAARKAEAVAALENRSGSLFEHLSKVAQLGGSATPAPAATPAAATAAATAAPGANGNGNGNGNGASAAATQPRTSKHTGQDSSSAWSVGNGDLAGPLTASQYVASYVKQFGQPYALERQMFLRRAGAEYGYGGRIDELYPREVGVRMQPVGPNKAPQHYLDYTGSSVYCQSQLEAAFKELATTMFGNPHAQNPSSELSSQRIEEVRSMILSFFHADPAEWQLVFTRSATGALKLVGETFPWSSGSLFRYLRENHNSVLGIREYALQHGAAFQAVDEMLVQDWLRSPQPPKSGPLPAACRHDHTPDSCTGTNAEGVCPVDWDVEETSGAASAGSEESASAVQAAAAERNGNGTGNGTGEGEEGADADVTYSLFAFPPEDNFAGVKYPLSWAAGIKARSTDNHKWLVMLDAAAYVPTQPLNLSEVQADFVDLSFYKIFGYPTGLGCLLVRTEAVELLRKVFWGGGSVALATSNDNFHVLKCRPTDKLEDGTVSFLDIISLRHGFNLINQLGGITKVQAHVACLTEWLYEAVTKLRHSNGRPMVRVFGKHARANHREVQGGILNFELLSPQGRPLSYKAFERDAAAAGFHVRTGAECNPGACYAYLGVPESEVEALAGVKEGCEDEVEFITIEKPLGSRDSVDAAAGQRPGPASVSSQDVLRMLATTPVSLGHPAEVASKWVQVPLGSVRASLGWMSTFEDCYAFVDFIRATCKDREATPLEPGQQGAGAPSA